MNQLRRVVLRTENKPVEQDLRGLGNEPFFLYSHPVTVLSAFGENGLLGQKFNKLISRTTPGCNHYTSSIHSGQHKKSAVEIFAAVLGLHEILPADCKLILWEANPLSQLMLKAMDERTFHPSATPLQDAIDNDFLKLHADTKDTRFLKVFDPVTLHLNQAGFVGIETKTTSQNWTSEQLTVALQAELSGFANVVSTGSRKKVG